MNKYRLIKKLGEGTFSEVFKAQSLKTGAFVAIKCMKSHYQSIEQVNDLREIQALKRLSSHQNIINLIEYLYDDVTGRLSLVFNLMDLNLYETIKGRKNYLSERKIKMWMYQLLKALDHMHRSGIFHRDIKPENILIKNDHLVLADLGSCKGIYSKPPFTEYISTRWYRAPECLLTDGHYNYKMDMWGVGCVLFEIASLFPLFPGDNELDQIIKIQNILGPISQDVLNAFKKNSSHIGDYILSQKNGIGISKFLTHSSSEMQDLIMKLLVYNPEERYSAKQALQHQFFKELVDQESKMQKLSLNGFNQLMKSSFLNDSQSQIKSTEDTQSYHRNTNKMNTNFLKNENKNEKALILPEIKSYETNKSKNNSIDYDSENIDNTAVKLLKLNRQIDAVQNRPTLDLKLVINTIINDNSYTKNNQSMDMQLNTEYSKKIKLENKSINKKVLKFSKKNYVSPYSQKKMFG